MALLPLVEMGTAPPIVRGYDMLQPIIRFSHWHQYSDSCSCLIEKHSQTMAVIRLSCSCKHTDYLLSGGLSILLPRLFTQNQAVKLHQCVNSYNTSALQIKVTFFALNYIITYSPSVNRTLTDSLTRREG